jgi:hypothetical protein
MSMPPYRRNRVDVVAAAAACNRTVVWNSATFVHVEFVIVWSVVTHDDSNDSYADDAWTRKTPYFART